MLGSVLHLSIFCRTLVFKWKVLSTKGSRTKAKSFFSVLKFLFRRRVGLLLPFLKNIMRKHGGKASSFCSSSLALFLDCVEVIFYH